MRASTNSDEVKNGGRRMAERRKADQPYVAPDQRETERRGDEDRRKAPRLPLD